MKKLVILDVDNCLIYASRSIKDYDFEIPYYYIKKRDHLDKFLNHLFSNYDVGIWSANFYRYVHAIVDGLGIKDKVKFIHTEDDCQIDFDDGLVKYIKNISQVEDYGYDLKNVIMVDDNPRGFPNYKENVIFINSYEGKSDDSLLKVQSTIDSAFKHEYARGNLNF